MFSFRDYNLFKGIDSALNIISRTLKMQITYMIITIIIRLFGCEISYQYIIIVKAKSKNVLYNSH